MNIRNALLVPVLTMSWVCLVQAAAPGAAWTVRQNFPVNRDCRINASATDAQGNLYLAGSMENGANEDFYVCKIDGATDTIVWKAVYNGPADDVDQATGCSLDSSGNLYVTGFSHNGEDFDALTIKYDAATGAEGWVKRYNTGVKTNEYASSLAADRFGNVYIAGTCNEDTLLDPFDENGSCHALVVKYNGADGDTIWSRHFGDLPDSLSKANDCCVDDSGNVYLVGYVSPGWSSMYSLAIKLQAANGDTHWVRRFAQNNNESAYNCCLDAAGNLIVVGTRGEVFNPDTIMVIRYDSADGDTLWTKTFPDNSLLPWDCAMAGDNALLVSTIRSYFGIWGDQYTVYKLAVDAGDTLWSRSFPVSGENISLPLAVRDTGVFYVSSSNVKGNINVWETWYDGIYTARHAVSTGGLIDSVTRGQSSAGGWNFAYDCAVAGSNGPAVVGSAGTFYAAVLHDPSDGHIAWEKRDPNGYAPPYQARNTRATGVAQNGGYVYTTGNVGMTDLLTYKFEAATGDTLWTAHSTFSLSAIASGDCALDPWGNVFVTGYRLGDFGLNTVAVKYHQDTGDTLWVRNSNVLYKINACTADSSGAFYELGLWYTNAGYVIVKHDNSTGDTLWTREFNVLGTDPADAQGICYSNGYLYVSGAAYNGGKLDFFLAKHDTASGDTVWCRMFDSPFGLEDRALACAADDSGFIYLTGASHNGTDYDYWTVKCGPGGDSLWSVRYDGPGHKDDLAQGCCVDSSGYLYVTGFSATGRGYDMVTIKYNTSYTGVTGGPATPHSGRYFLGSVYPNPSSGGKIALQYELPKDGQVTFSVYNIAGQRVRVLDQGKQPGGVHKMIWDGTDRHGSRVASGVYILRCELGDLSATRKVLVVR